MEGTEMIDISSKFRTWLLEKDKWGLLQPRAEMCSDTLEIGFFYGYTIAQKELEEQLKETISEFKNCYKALEFFEKHADCRTNNVYHCNCNFCKDREHMELKRDAREFLKKTEGER